MNHFPRFARLAAIAAVALIATASVQRAFGEEPTVRIAILKFGTVSWQLDVVTQHGLDRKFGITLDVVALANKDASTIAFNGGNVDMIVTDWMWVSRQRDAGADFTLVPYSAAVGAVMVHPDSGIETVADLKGKVMGVAGSPIDKSWLLFRAYAIQETGGDIAKDLQPAYAAPPLLNEKFRQGELDAVLNYWNYTARLRAAGMVELISVRKMLPALGLPGELPMIGFVFRESWARENPAALEGFLQAIDAATAIMRDSDEEWQRLMPDTGAKDQAMLEALRDEYRAGIPKDDGSQHQETVRSAFRLIAELGGRALVGTSTELAPGTFWTGAK